MKRRMQNVTAAAPLWQNDPNYPGAPPEVLSKVQHRATVDYDTYVLRYQAAQRANALLTAAGVAAVAAGIVALRGDATILAVIIGLGLMAGGGVGLLTAATAHAEYKQMAVSVTETYAPRPEAKPPQVRAFVSSENGRLTNTGRLQFEPQVWQSLFDLALMNGGIIDRDNVCKKSGIGRRWYHSDPNSADGFRAFQAELRQLGFIDARNRLTDGALKWYAEQIPLPLSALALRSPADRPTADRPEPTGWEL